MGFWTGDFCGFGTPWPKRTKFFITTSLQGLKTLCPGCAAHQILRGRSKVHRKSWTCVAETYPRGLALVVAMSLAGACGDRPEYRRLNATTCARCICARIGEAANPGPKKSTTFDRAERRKGIELAEISLVKGQEWIWRDLETYGQHLFKIGAPLSSFRHLIAYAQRNLADFRQHAKICWDLVSRWEVTEPLVHRPPLPLKLCEAMVGLALSWAGHVSGLCC